MLMILLFFAYYLSESRTPVSSTVMRIPIITETRIISLLVRRSRRLISSADCRDVSVCFIVLIVCICAGQGKMRAGLLLSLMFRDYAVLLRNGVKGGKMNLFFVPGCVFRGRTVEMFCEGTGKLSRTGKPDLVGCLGYGELPIF
jgi:hypothetical protein